MGSRVGGEIPKQLLPLMDGRSILEHSVDAFEQALCIDEIVIVMHPDWVAQAQRLCLQNSWQKVQQIIPGGKERWESSWKAIQAVSGEGTCLWFHDAARPFVSQRILADVAECLEHHNAVTVAVPVTDTIYRVERQESRAESQEPRLESIPARTDFMRAQTPQAFRFETIQEAYRRAIESGEVAATDDAGIVHKYLPDEVIYIVEGEETNKKITYKEDL